MDVLKGGFNLITEPAKSRLEIKSKNNDIAAKNVELPYKHDYWKEHAMKMQATSRHNGGRTASTNQQQFDQKILPNVNQHFSPVNDNSIRGGVTTSNAQLRKRFNFGVLTTPGISESSSYHLNPIQNRAIMTPQDYIQKRGSTILQKQSIPEEDSMYELRPTQQQDANIKTEQSSTLYNLYDSKDSLYDQSIDQKQVFKNEPMKSKGAYCSFDGRNQSIYSAQDNFAVTNIIRKNFPKLARESNATVVNMSQDVDTQLTPIRESRFQANKKLKNGGKRNVTQINVGVLSNITKSRDSMGNISFTPTNYDPQQHQITYQSQRVSPKGIKADFIMRSTSSQKKSTQTIIFNKTFQNSVFTESQSIAGQQKVNIGQHEKKYYNRTSYKTQPTSRLQKGPDYLKDNMKNLNVSINKLHPQYSLYDSKNERGAIKFIDEDQEEAEKKQMAVTNKHNALVGTMEQQVTDSSTLNASEVLASVGISNNRASNMKYAKQSNLSKVVNTSMTARNKNNMTVQLQPIFKEESGQVQQIINSMQIKHETSSSKKTSSLNARKMVGKTNYDLLSLSQLRETYKLQQSEKKRNYISLLAAKETSLEGKITMKDYDQKMATFDASKPDPIKDYAKNFSSIEHLLKETGLQNNDAAKAFSNELLKNFQKVKTEQEEKKRQQKELFGDEVQEDEIEEINVFNQLLDEEKNFITKMGDEFLAKVKYMNQVQQREVEYIGKGQMQFDDPKIHYYLQCKEAVDLVLPILDKVIKKTLVLQEYTLNEGHCQALARACEYFDNQYINRILINNCGITDVDFSHIIEGMTKLKDFKSIIYKMNAFSDLSIAALKPLVLKRLPNHLQELKLIDCQIGGTHLCRLMDLLMENRSQLQSLALINVGQTDNSFAKVTEFLEHSNHLTVLNLSLQKLNIGCWKQFLEVMSHNRQLINLNISNNKILENQPRPTTEELRDNNWELSDKNLETITYFKDFIKYNVQLISINLESTGLTVPAVRLISSYLTRSQGLRCIHLCSNEGATDDVIELIRSRIRASVPHENRVIITFNEYKAQINKLNRNQKEVGAALLQKFNVLGKIKEDKQWQHIREALKLQRVIHCKRINELSTQTHKNDIEGSYLSHRLIIERNLGLKLVMPNSGQWRIKTYSKQQCWHCSQHILTLFIWTPRIGALSCEKNKEKITYYKKQIEAIRDSNFLVASDSNKTPLIAADFNDWRYQKMQEVIEFCINGDYDAPDFRAECVADGNIRADSGKYLNIDEARILRLRKEAYYKQNWQTVLMRIVRYRKPMVANAHCMTQENLSADPESPVYIHMAWVKPGRHTYAISQDNDFVDTDDHEVGANQLSNLFFGKKFAKASTVQVKKKNKFFLHEMLATFREEKVPFCFNPRHVRRIVKDKHIEKPIFVKWQKDSPDVVTQMFNHDRTYWSIESECLDSHEYKVLEHVLVTNFALIQDVYHYMQAKSNRYPLIEFYTVRKFFFDELVMGKNAHYMYANFDVATNKVVGNNQKKIYENEGSTKDNALREGDKALNRHAFFELIVILAKMTFQNNTKDEQLDRYEQVNVVQATALFLRNVVKKFHKTKQIEWQDFRDNRLWQSEVRLVYTMNESYLEQIYKRYSAMGLNTGFKGNKAEFMVLDDCIRLVIRDMKLLLNKPQIREAFAMCKMSVVDETSREALKLYAKISFVEFLEFLARIAELNFKGSEMEDLELYEKLEYLLDDLFEILPEAKRVKQSTIVEEFSDSDPEY